MLPESARGSKPEPAEDRSRPARRGEILRSEAVHVGDPCERAALSRSSARGVIGGQSALLVLVQDEHPDRPAAKLHRLLVGIVAEVDTAALDISSGVPRDRVAVALDVEMCAERDDRRVNGDDGSGVDGGTADG